MEPARPQIKLVKQLSAKPNTYDHTAVTATVTVVTGTISAKAKVFLAKVYERWGRTAEFEAVKKCTEGSSGWKGAALYGHLVGR